MRILDPDQRALAVASTQHGVLSLTQATSAGLSPKQVLVRVRQGRWRRAVKGVYVVAGSPDSALQRVWVTYLATATGGGVLSHLTAVARHGVLTYPTLPHAIVRPTASVRAKVGRIHRGVVPFEDTQVIEGVRYTKPSRTLVDIAPMVDRPTLEEVVDVLFCAKKATAESTLAAADREGAPRAGRVELRSVVEVWTRRIEPGSVAEVRLLRELRGLGVTDVVTQHEVFDAGGAFIGRLDAAVPRLRVGLEYDGVETHNPRAWSRDEQRYARLAAAGWSVDGVTKVDLLPGEARLRRIVERWLHRAAA